MVGYSILTIFRDKAEIHLSLLIWNILLYVLVLSYCIVCHPLAISRNM